MAIECAYHQRERERREIISENRSRRLRKGTKLPPIPVPDKLPKPMVRVAYTPDGTYYGRLIGDEEVPEGFTVKLEPAMHCGCQR